MARRYLAGTSWEWRWWRGRACRDLAATKPEDLSACRKLSAVLRHGDTFVVEALGSSIAQHLWPASSEEYRQAAEEKRVLYYRLRKQGEGIPALASDEGASRYRELLATHRTEQEAAVAELVARGIAPSPPADWTEPAL